MFSLVKTEKYLFPEPLEIVKSRIKKNSKENWSFENFNPYKVISQSNSDKKYVSSVDNKQFVIQRFTGYLFSHLGSKIIRFSGKLEESGMGTIVNIAPRLEFGFLGILSFWSVMSVLYFLAAIFLESVVLLDAFGLFVIITIGTVGMWLYGLFFLIKAQNKLPEVLADVFEKTGDIIK